MNSNQNQSPEHLANDLAASVYGDVAGCLKAALRLIEIAHEGIAESFPAGYDKNQVMHRTAVGADAITQALTYLAQG